MRKLKIQVQMSVDGFVADANGGMDWLNWNWDQELGNYVETTTQTVDEIVLGRKLAEGFIPHWAGVAADSQHPEHEAGKIFNNLAKVVFSKTLENLAWPNTRLVSGDLHTEIVRMKALEGGDIIAYGGASFVSALLAECLVDELHLFVNPALLGEGKPIFRQIKTAQKLTLVSSVAYSNGIVVLCYKIGA